MLASETVVRGSRPRDAIEVVAVFATAVSIIAIGWSIVGQDPFAKQVVVWVANLAMLAVIGTALRRRGGSASELGLETGYTGWWPVARAVLWSFPVVVVALVAFVAGGAPFAGAETPQSADMSGYTWLQGNLPMLLIALPAIWIVSSLGEEVVYRGFLMSRVAAIAGGGRAGWAIAAVVSAVIFGLAHFAWGLVGIVQTTFLGLALAAAWLLLKRNLWPLVLAHVWIDTLLIVQLYSS